MRGSTMSYVANVTEVSSEAIGKTLYIRAVEAGTDSGTDASIESWERSTASVF